MTAPIKNIGEALRRITAVTAAAGNPGKNAVQLTNIITSLSETVNALSAKLQELYKAIPPSADGFSENLSAQVGNLKTQIGKLKELIPMDAPRDDDSGAGAVTGYVPPVVPGAIGGYRYGKKSKRRSKTRKNKRNKKRRGKGKSRRR